MFDFDQTLESGCSPREYLHWLFYFGLIAAVLCGLNLLLDFATMHKLPAFEGVVVKIGYDRYHKGPTYFRIHLDQTTSFQVPLRYCWDIEKGDRIRHEAAGKSITVNDRSFLFISWFGVLGFCAGLTLFLARVFEAEWGGHLGVWLFENRIRGIPQGLIILGLISMVYILFFVNPPWGIGDN